MSVTAVTVPSVVDKVMVAPPVVRLLPLASFAWIVISDVLAPSAVMDVGDAVIVVVAVLAEPVTKLTVALSVIAVLFNVPVMVAIATMVPDVSVAE